MDSKLQKWLKWTDEIHEETQRLLIKTYLYDRYVEIVKANSSVWAPDDFHQWAMRNYFDSALMCIRRLVKVQQRDGKIENISLKGLLMEIQESSELITKEFYLRDYQRGKVDESGVPDSQAWTYALGEDTYAEKWAGGGVALADIVAKDITELEEKTKIVEDFIDNTLAHRQKGAKGKQSIKTEVARQAIDVIEKIAIKYIELMGKGSYSELTPTWQYDPEEIFLKPWISRENQN